MLSVRSLREHGLLHIGSVVGVNLPDVLNGDHPPGVDDGISIGVGEENSTSGSEPVSKSASTLAFQPSLEVAEPSLTLFPVAAS